MTKVFYIEKQKFLREMVEQILVDKGEKAYTLETASDCTYLIEDLKPEVLMLDVATIMPEADEFFATYKEKFSQIPIVFTGFPEDRDLLGPYEGLCRGFLEKPIKPMEFWDQMEKMGFKG